MAVNKWTKLRRLNVAAHRDLGYFFSALIIVYCISGLALNHVNEWNPDFMISKDTLQINKVYNSSSVNNALINSLGRLVGEEKYKVYDAPTKGQVKVYYDNASLHVNFDTHTGIYEKVARRPLFYQVNVLHRNSLKGWRWASDVFAVMLITICITGLFVMKGKYGITGRGKWLIAAGLLPPVAAIIIQALM
jgi:hypothetical protein